MRNSGVVSAASGTLQNREGKMEEANGRRKW